MVVELSSEKAFMDFLRHAIRSRVRVSLERPAHTLAELAVRAYDAETVRLLRVLDDQDRRNG
jgi:hypothetical protein